MINVPRKTRLSPRVTRRTLVVPGPGTRNRPAALAIPITAARRLTGRNELSIGVPASRPSRPTNWNAARQKFPWAARNLNGRAIKACY